jgi:putative membrane protein
MPGIFSVTVWAFSAVPFLSLIGSVGTAPDPQSEKQSVLNMAAEEVQVEISLGQLAAQRASNRQVKEYGEHMVEDHQKASQQVELLALKKGVQLSPDNKHEYQEQLEQLARLSGHAFDREYLDYSIRSHENSVEEFRRHVDMVQDHDIKQWINLVVPILEGHREKARRVKYSLQTNP